MVYLDSRDNQYMYDGAYILKNGKPYAVCISVAGFMLWAERIGLHQTTSQI